jgi:hypothetical protein
VNLSACERFDCLGHRAGYGIADLLDPLRDKSQKSEAGDIVNNFIAYKPASCKWHHLTWTNTTVRDRFEFCTGVTAAMAQVQTTSAALFVVSTFLSPGGLAFMPISAAIQYLLERSCRKSYLKDPITKREFWTDEVRQLAACHSIESLLNKDRSPYSV